MPRTLGPAVLAALALAGRPAQAQVSQVIVPQGRSFHVGPASGMGSIGEAVVVEQVKARVVVRDQAATTTLDVQIRNPGANVVEGLILLPVPEGAAVTEFLLGGGTTDAGAQLLPRDEARRVYDDIVRRARDPALLEFVDWRTIRSSVFPIPARSTQTLRLVYHEVLASDGGRIDYVLPRSEAYDAAARWTVEMDVRTSWRIGAVYSPTHELAIVEPGPSERIVRIGDGGAGTMAPGPVRCSFLVESGDMAATVFAYPDASFGGGYLLFVAGVPEPQAEGKRQPREVTLVLDRSGSMAGEKMDQAAAAALQVIEGLDDGERFNIVDYATYVSTFRPEPVTKDRDTTLAARAYLAQLKAAGGTNIHGALARALEQPHEAAFLPIVLFLTDGLPTVGETSEASINAIATGANPHGRRIHTFGVGHDVNAPLLDRLADVTGAATTYAQPGEDIELKVAQAFRRLQGPILSGIRVASGPQANQPDRLQEIVPPVIPDVFAGDRLVVLAKYLGTTPLRIEISGNHLGAQRTFAYDATLDKATTRNAFVPRLWATRQIAYLVDQVRQLGGEGAGLPLAGGASHPALSDPRVKELVDEIMRLSTEYGVLTEYTAFLATEPANLGDWSTLSTTCSTLLNERAVQTRSGQAAVSQSLNFNDKKQAQIVDASNRYWNADMEQVEIGGLRQVCDVALFNQSGRWVDGRAINRKAAQPQETIEFGSEAWRALFDRLVREHRGGVLALRGELVLLVDGRSVLVRNDPAAPPAPVAPPLGPVAEPASPADDC